MTTAVAATIGVSAAGHLASLVGIQVGTRVRIREGCSCAGIVFTVTEILGMPDVTEPECVQVFGDLALGPVRLTELKAMRS